MNCDGVVVSNNIIDCNSKTTSDGIFFGTSQVNIIVENNNIRNVGTGKSAINNASGTGARIRNNLGFNPQGTTGITLTGSPMTITAGATPEVFYIRSGSVTSIVKDTRTILASTNVSVTLEPGESITVTYTGTPVIERDRK